MYAWTITKDFITDGKSEVGTNCNAVGVIGPRDASLTHEEIVRQGKKFQMFDDDMELYYEGYLVGGDGFEPVDDFGMPNAGAVHIKIDGELL